MPYNNYFPASYQPVYYQPQTQTQYQPQSSSVTWIQGENAAKSYPVAPGTSVLLLDSEKSCFYIKSADGSGMPLPLRIFDYTERTQTNPVSVPAVAQETAPNLDDYVTREELENRLAQLSKETEPVRARKEKNA